MTRTKVRAPPSAIIFRRSASLHRLVTGSSTGERPSGPLAIRVYQCLSVVQLHSYDLGAGAAVGRLAGGIMMVGAIAGAFIFSRKSKQPTSPAVPTSTPSALPTGPVG